MIAPYNDSDDDADNDESGNGCDQCGECCEDDDGYDVEIDGVSPDEYECELDMDIGGNGKMKKDVSDVLSSVAACTLVWGSLAGILSAIIAVNVWLWRLALGG